MMNDETASKFTKIITDFLSEIPSSSEPLASDTDTARRARQLANNAAANAAMVSGGLSLPPGPLGMLTVLPDLVAVWKIQAQMVADIAAVYGRQTELTREHMLICLFKHVASHSVRGMFVRTGERILVRRASTRVIQKVLQQIGVKVTQRTTARIASRWLPIIGAVGVGAYAYYDTARVAKTTLEIFATSEVDKEFFAEVCAENE